MAVTETQQPERKRGVSIFFRGQLLMTQPPCEDDQKFVGHVLYESIQAKGEPHD